MDIRHLQTLRAVVDVGSFTGAAERLFLTQSAVSVQIRQLEQAVGTTLFTRLPSGVRATHAGEVLYRYAGRILAVADEARRELSAIEGGRDQAVRVATTDVCAFAISLPMTRFAAKHPDTDVAVFEGSADAARRRLDDGDADLAVIPVITTGQPRPTTPDEALLPLVLVAIGSADHPCATATALTIADLSAYPLALYEPGHIVRDLVDSAAHATQTELRILFESNWLSSLVRAVEAGTTLAIAPEPAIAPERDDGRIFVARIPELEGSVALHLLTAEPARASVRGLAHEIVAHAADVRSASRVGVPADEESPTPRTPLKPGTPDAGDP